MKIEYRVYDTEQKRYITDERIKKFIIAWDDIDACFALTTKSGGRTTYHYDEYTMDDTHEMEVIGNKWDNPELLKA